MPPAQLESDIEISFEDDENQMPSLADQNLMLDDSEAEEDGTGISNTKKVPAGHDHDILSPIPDLPFLQTGGPKTTLKGIRCSLLHLCCSYCICAKPMTAGSLTSNRPRDQNSSKLCFAAPTGLILTQQQKGEA